MLVGHKCTADSIILSYTEDSNGPYPYVLMKRYNPIYLGKQYICRLSILRFNDRSICVRFVSPTRNQIDKYYHTKKL